MFKLITSWVVYDANLCKLPQQKRGSGQLLHQIGKIQAEAELCQAQEKLGLAKQPLPSKKLMVSSI